MTNTINKVRIVGCRILPSWALAAVFEVEVAAAMALVDEKNAEKDCATAMACGVAVVVALAVDEGCVLESATVTGEFSLPCSDRVIVTKEATGDNVKELGGVDAEICTDIVDDEDDAAVVVACTEAVAGVLDELVITGGGGESGGGGGASAAAGGGPGAGVPGAEGPGVRGGITWF